MTMGSNPKETSPPQSCSKSLVVTPSEEQRGTEVEGALVLYRNPWRMGIGGSRAPEFGFA